jgi:hypothetical protein
LIDEDDAFPTKGTYLGVPLFAFQSERRLKVVRADIDRVIQMANLADLAALACDSAVAPEARLLGAEKALQILRGIGDARQRRPRGLTIDTVVASVATTGSRFWANAHFHCGDLENEARAAKREVPLPCPPFTG